MKRSLLSLVFGFTLILVNAQIDSVKLVYKGLVTDSVKNFNYSLESKSGIYNLTQIWDVDTNGVKDIIAGAPFENSYKGNLYLILLEKDFSIKSVKKLENQELSNTLHTDDRFGLSLINVGDINGDGIDDIASGAPQVDDGYYNSGAIFILFLDKDANISEYTKISATQGGITGLTSNAFMSSSSYLGDINGDGIGDIVVAAQSGNFKGRLMVLCLNTDGTVKEQINIGDNELGFTVGEGDEFGISITNMGDLNGDGNIDLAVAARYAYGYGAIYTLLMNDDWTVKSHNIISNNMSGFSGILGSNNWFGISTINAGDLNNDGINDILACSYDDVYGVDNGALWVLYLKSDGSVKSFNKITSDGFPGVKAGDKFGVHNINLGDINGDGINDFSIGSHLCDGKKADVGGFFFANFEKMYKIEGSVLTSDSLVSGSEVVLYRETTENSSAIDTVIVTDGYFSFYIAISGNYWVKAIPQGNLSEYYFTTFYPEQINISNENISNLHIQLQRKIKIKGSVFADDSLVTKAKVILYKNNQEDTSALDSVIVTKGFFTFDVKNSGTYWVKAIPQGNLSDLYYNTVYPEPLNLTINDITEIDIQLQRKIKIEGSVLVGDSLVTDAKVVLYKNNQNDSSAIDTVIVTEGFFTFDIKDSGVYWVKAIPQGIWSENSVNTFFPMQIDVTEYNIGGIDIQLDQKVGLKSIFSSIIICPNPASDYITLSNISVPYDKVLVAVYNINGQKINCDFTVSGNSITINISKLKTGNYQLFIQTENDIFTEKFIKK